MELSPPYLDHMVRGGLVPGDSVIELAPDRFGILMLKDKETKKGTVILARVMDPDCHKELLLYSSSREDQVCNPRDSVRAS